MRNEGDKVKPCEPGWEKLRRVGEDPDLDSESESASDSVSDKEVTTTP